MPRALRTASSFRWTPWAAVGLGGVLAIAMFTSELSTMPTWHAVANALPAATWLAAGFIAARARPQSLLGGLLLIVGVLAPFSFSPPGTSDVLPLSVAQWLLSTALWGPLFHFVIAFPGRRLAGRERLLVVAAYAYGIARGLTALVRPGSSCPSCGHDPIAIHGLDGLAGLVVPANTVIALVLVLAGLSIGASHWRRATLPARRVLGPVLVSGLALAAIYLVAGLLDANGYGPHPAAAGIVLDLAIVLTTALIPFGFLAGLIRTRVTRSTVGELMVGLSSVEGQSHLRDLLARALGDDSLRVGFWVPERSGYVDSAGGEFEVPGEDLSRVTAVSGPEGALAVLVHDPALRDDDGLLDAVVGAARLGLENGRLQAEVRAQLQEVRDSRARVVRAGDEERRRIERDLHDGAQQRLVGLALALRMAKSQIPRGDLEAEGLLARAVDGAQAALAELRELARGLHPQVLSQGGLSAAVDSLVERAGVPVQVGVLTQQRFGESVELAAYHVVAEAVANAERHGGARLVTVAAGHVGGELRVQIDDDGSGGARLVEGHGLAGLADRLEALGGWLALQDAPSGGTRIRACIPLRIDQPKPPPAPGPPRNCIDEPSERTSAPATPAVASREHKELVHA